MSPTVNTENVENIDNQIECRLKITRGFILKNDLRLAIRASSMKVLRGDVAQFVSLKTEFAQLYEGYEKKHSVTKDFAVTFLKHLFENCRIVFTN